MSFSNLFFFKKMRLLNQYLWVWLILSSLFLGNEQPLGKSLAQGQRIRQPAEGGGLTSMSLSYHAAVKFRTHRLWNGSHRTIRPKRGQFCPYFTGKKELEIWGLDAAVDLGVSSNLHYAWTYVPFLLAHISHRLCISPVSHAAYICSSYTAHSLSVVH